MTPHQARRGCRKAASQPSVFAEQLEPRMLLSAAVGQKKLAKPANGMSHQLVMISAYHHHRHRTQFGVAAPAPAAPALVTAPTPTPTPAAPTQETPTQPVFTPAPTEPTAQDPGTVAPSSDAPSQPAPSRAPSTPPPQTSTNAPSPESVTPAPLPPTPAPPPAPPVQPAPAPTPPPPAASTQPTPAPVAPTPQPVSPPATPPVQYDWHTQMINGVLNIWAPNPSDFGTTYAVTDPNALFGSDGVPQVEGVHQGMTPDCYVYATAGAIAQENPGRIQSIVRNDPGGGWAVTFQYSDGTQAAKVPMTIHTDNKLSSTMQALAPNGEVWSQVIEKAFAAFRTWDGSSSVNTLGSLALGNGWAMIQALDGAYSSTPLRGQSNQAVYDTLQTNLAAGIPMIMLTTNSAPTMVANHYYIISGVHTDASGKLWVTVYNPWGFYDNRTVAELMQNGVGSLDQGVP